MSNFVNNKINYLADFCTFLSLVFGFFSIILSLEQHFTAASWCIIISVILDGIDGQIARFYPIPSDFGKELDSLVDVVSFGIAPFILGYVFIYRHFHFLAVLALLVYLFSSVFRLARFNITPKEKITYFFIGLPTTVSGGILASFILIYRKKQDMFIPDFIPSFLSARSVSLWFLVVIFLLSFLMMSKVKYINLDGLRYILGKNIKVFLFSLVAVFSVAITLNKAGITLFCVFLIYLIFSPFVVKRFIK